MIPWAVIHLSPRAGRLHVVNEWKGQGRATRACRSWGPVIDVSGDGPARVYFVAIPEREPPPGIPVCARCLALQRAAAAAEHGYLRDLERHNGAAHEGQVPGA